MSINFYKKIEEFKRKVSFLSVLENQGYKIDKYKSCGTSKTYKKEGVSDIIISIREDGTHQFFERSTRSKGDIIDFHTRVMGINFKDIIEVPINRNINTNNFASTDLKLEKKEKKSLEESHQNTVQDFFQDHSGRRINIKIPQNCDKNNYLTSIRKINLSYVVKLRSSVGFFERAARFKTYLVNEKNKWVEVGHITYKLGIDGKTRKYNGKNLIKGLSIVSSIPNPNFQREKKNQIYLFAENPIDALSYAQLHKISSFCVVATCGTPSKPALESLDFFKNKNEKIILADNDGEGKRLADLIAKNIKTSTIVFPDKPFKDFNEELVLKEKKHLS